MKLYVVRHGETDYNQMGLLQGRTDIPLNENGKKQALEAQKELKDISFDLVISSPMIRAIETATLIVPLKNVLIDRRLEERGLGEYEGKSKKIYDQELYHNYFKNCTEHGVEGIQQLIHRVDSFIEELKRNYYDKTILLVTHGTWLNALLYCFEPIPTDGKLRRMELKNGKFIEFCL